MNQKSQKYKIVRQRKTTSEEIYQKVENFINIMHDDEAMLELEKKYKIRSEWAMKNIRVGSLVNTNCSYIINLFEVKDRTTKNFVGQWIEPLPKDTQIMSLGYQLIRVYRTELGESLSSPTYEIQQKWMIEDKIVICNIHPMHFEPSQVGTGELWDVALHNEELKAAKLLNERHSTTQYTLSLPDFDKLVNFWSGVAADNPVRIDAFIDNE